MKVLGVLFVALVTLFSSVTGLRSYEANVRVDFGTTLRTGEVEDFSRRQYVNGHGSFKKSPRVIPREMMDYLTTELKVSFSRSTRGPFKQAIFPARTTQSSVLIDGQNDLEDQQCEDCDQYQFRFLSNQRVVTDDPYKIPEIDENEQTRSRAVTYAGFFFRYFFDDKFMLPDYYECFNEPMGKFSKLRKKGESQREFITRVSNLCTDLCKEVNKHTKMLTGGPANEFVRPSFDNFDMFRSRMKVYMDAAAKGGCQGFVSEHVYNIGGSYGEANLDLVQTYSAMLSEDGKPQPYLVSEMGQYVASWYNRNRGFAAKHLPSRDFSIMSESMKVLMTLMKIPDNLLQVITFLNLETQAQRDIKNGNPYPWSLIHEKEDGSVEFSNLVRYFELLKGMDGKFVYSNSDNIDLSVNAVATKKRGYIIMQNLSDKEAEINFEFPHGKEQLRGYEIRRLRIDKKRVTSEEKRQNILVGGDVNWTIRTERAEKGRAITLPQTITLDRFEMTVIEVEFKKGSRDLRKVQRSRHYASFVRGSENEKVDFPAPILRNKKVHYFFRDLPSSRGGVAAIRISHSRPLGTAEKPDVYVNDVRLSPESFSADVAGGYKKVGDPDYFGTFVVYYNLEKLTSRKNAKVSVSYPDQGGWSTSVVVEIDQCKGSSCCVLANRENGGPCKPSDDSGFLRPEPTPIPLE